MCHPSFFVGGMSDDDLKVTAVVTIKSVTVFYLAKQNVEKVTLRTACCLLLLSGR